MRRIYDASTGFVYSFTVVDTGTTDENGNKIFQPVFTRVEGSATSVEVAFDDFARRVLLKIGACDQFASPELPDLQNVQDAYDSIYAILLDDGLVTWAADDDIPARFTLPLIDLVATQIKPIYGKPLTITDMLPILEQPAVKTLRRQMARPYVPETIEGEYF